MDMPHLIKQKGYERIVYILRRHPFTFLPKVILFLVLAAVPVILFWMINNLFPQLFVKEFIYAMGVLFASVYYLSILLFFYTQFLVFYLDMWIVTNDRIVDIEQLGLFSRTISEVDLFRIQDVTTDVHGLFATLLHYGDVTIKTASDNVSIIFYKVEKPNIIREQLIRLSDEDRKFHFPGSVMDEH